MMEPWQIWGLAEHLTVEQWDIVVDSIAASIDRGLILDNYLSEAHDIVMAMKAYDK